MRSIYFTRWLLHSIYTIDTTDLVIEARTVFYELTFFPFIFIIEVNIRSIVWELNRH